MRPLEGIRVVELGVWVAGPGAGGVLADWGADVIKVESPAGDPMRQLFAVMTGHGQPASPPFDLDNRNKRSVVLDLSAPDGVDDLRALLATADVFITNLRPEAVTAFGFGAEAILAEFPRLVYGQVTGFGRSGPDAHRAGYDMGAFWARSGMASVVAPEGEPPPTLAAATGDHATGMALVAGVLAALFMRERTGEGQLVDTSLLRNGLYGLGWNLGTQLRFGKHGPTLPRTQNQNPMFNCHVAGDGKWFWTLGLEGQRHFPNLMRAIGRDDLLDDERFNSGRGRRKNAEAMVALLDDAFLARTRAEWFDVFDAHDVWFAPVNSLADAVADPQVLAVGGIVDVPDAAGADAHRAVATPIDFSAAPDVHAHRGVPGLGEHTDEVLREIGRR